MTRGPFGLAADMIDAGALELADVCTSRGVDPWPALAGLALAVRDDDLTTTEGTTHEP